MAQKGEEQESCRFLYFVTLIANSFLQTTHRIPRKTQHKQSSVLAALSTKETNSTKVFPATSQLLARVDEIFTINPSSVHQNQKLRRRCAYDVYPQSKKDDGMTESAEAECVHVGNMNVLFRNIASLAINGIHLESGGEAPFDRCHNMDANG